MSLIFPHVPHHRLYQELVDAHRRKRQQLALMVLHLQGGTVDELDVWWSILHRISQYEASRITTMLWALVKRWKDLGLATVPPYAPYYSIADIQRWVIVRKLAARLGDGMRGYLRKAESDQAKIDGFQVSRPVQVPLMVTGEKTGSALPGHPFGPLDQLENGHCSTGGGK